jgi:hypothetical protein
MWLACRRNQLLSHLEQTEMERIHGRQEEDAVDQCTVMLKRIFTLAAQAAPVGRPCPGVFPTRIEPATEIPWGHGAKRVD